MKRYAISIASVVGILLAMYYINRPLQSKVEIGGHTFTTEVALTEAQKGLGLGYRASLPLSSGMLFVYDHREQYEFWMKGMQFPLDFIWIDGTTVADITPNVPQPNQNESPAIVKPLVPVDKVFEVNAGTVSRLNIQIGDTVRFIDR